MTSSTAREPYSAPTVDEGAITRADALARLLGFPRGRAQHPDGAYRGQSSTLALDDIVAHLSGNVTLGFDAADADGKSKFFAIDVDERFPARLPLIAGALASRGLTDASIVTSGSSPDRGKVIVFFARRRSASALNALAKEVLKEAMMIGDGWGVHRAQYVTIYPHGLSGGLVRIAGRNRRPDRNAQRVDVTFGFDGECKSWADVAPAKSTRLPSAPVRVDVAKRGAWVDRLLCDGLTWSGGTKKIVSTVYMLACESVRVHGSGPIGESEFRKWLVQIEARSPELEKPSPTTVDRRRVLAWERHGKRAWNAAQNKFAKGTLSPPGIRSLRERDNVPLPQRKVQEVIAIYASAKGITPYALGISYRQIAKHAGLGSAKAAFRAVAALVKNESIVIHDRGVAGEKGQKTILGLVPDGQTPADVLALGDIAGNVKKQRPIATKARALPRRIHRKRFFGAGAAILDRT